MSFEKEREREREIDLLIVLLLPWPSKDPRRFGFERERRDSK